MPLFGSGHEIVTSTTRPSTPIQGQMIYETDTKLVATYNGTSWYYYRPGEIIETIGGPCDGSTVTGVNTTYTLQNVTGQQDPGASYVDINGSAIAYTPPIGTTKVRYEFSFTRYWQYTHEIMHFTFFVGTNEVVYARFNDSTQYYPERIIHFSWTIPIGGASNTNTGRLSSWNSPLILKMQVRDYSTSNGGALHGTNYWNGTGSNQFHMPNINITAIA